MSDRSEKVKAGVFVLISAALFVASVALIAGLRMFKSTQTFYVEFEESVTGLESSSTVRYNGVPVGRVADIGFAPNAFPKIRVTIEVRPDLQVRESTIATLKPQGITGIYYIDLSDDEEAGSAAKRSAGATIRAGKSISVRIEKALTDFQQVVAHLNGILGENREAVGGTILEIKEAATSFTAALGDLRKTLDSTSKMASGLEDSLKGAIQSADEAIVEMRDIFRDAETQAIPGNVNAFLSEATATASAVREQVSGADVTGTLTKVQTLVDRMVDLEQEVAIAVRELRLGVAENRGTFLRMTSDLGEFAKNLKLVSRDVRREPSRLFFGQPKSDREGGR